MKTKKGKSKSNFEVTKQQKKQLEPEPDQIFHCVGGSRREGQRERERKEKQRAMEDIVLLWLCLFLFCFLLIACAPFFFFVTICGRNLVEGTLTRKNVSYDGDMYSNSIIDSAQLTIFSDTRLDQKKERRTQSKENKSKTSTTTMKQYHPLLSVSPSSLSL